MTIVVGIINATPDSFSGDGLAGKSAGGDPRVLPRRLDALADAGVGWVDVGAESTRPGSAPVDPEEQWTRLGPVLAPILNHDARFVVSVDTRSPRVAERVMALGVHGINDISGCPENATKMASIVARNPSTKRHLIVMDNTATVVKPSGSGPGETFYVAQSQEQGPTFVDGVCGRLRRLADAAHKGGLRPTEVILDPGVGFGKTPEQCLDVTLNLVSRVRPYRLMVGASRKSFLGLALNLLLDQRLGADLAIATAAQNAGVDLLRVHDAVPVHHCLRTNRWIKQQGESRWGSLHESDR